MATVREVLTFMIDRAVQRRNSLLVEAQAIQTRIEDLQAQRAALTPTLENVLAQLQALGTIKTEN